MPRRSSSAAAAIPSEPSGLVEWGRLMGKVGEAGDARADLTLIAALACTRDVSRSTITRIAASSLSLDTTLSMEIGDDGEPW